MATKASKKPAAPPPSPQRDVFVIMPFSATKSCTEEQWTDIFENVFCPAAAAADLSCSRARVATGSLIKSIVERLRTSYIVLADITDANPNVFYELGVRHSLSKRTIIAAQGASHIPSDLRGYWSLIYGTGPGQVKKFARDLKDIVDQINAEPEKPDNPVGDYLERTFVQETRLANLDVVRRLSALHTELTGMEVELGVPCRVSWPSCLSEHPCLSMLLDERYLDPGDKILILGYELRQLLRHWKMETLSENSAKSLLPMVRDFGSAIGVIRQAVIGGDYTHLEKVSLMEWNASTYPGDGMDGNRIMPCTAWKGLNLGPDTEIKCSACGR